MCWQRRAKKLYILLGTNTLTTLGASDRFSGLLRPDAGQAAPDAGRGLHYLCTVHPAGATLRQLEKSRALPRMCCAA